MDFKELLKLSFTALKANKMRSILTTLGVIIGVFAVIILVSLGSGLQQYITNEITNLGSNLIFVIPGRVGGARTAGGQATNKLTIADSDNLAIKLRNLAKVGPVISKNATVKYKNKTNKSTSILGTSSNYPDIIKTEIVSGIYFNLSQEKSAAKVAVIGQSVQKNLFDGKLSIGNRINIAGQRYTIIGVLKARGSTFGIDQDNIAIIPVTSAKQQFGATNVNSIYLSALKPEFVTLIKERTIEILSKRLTEDDFTVQTEEQTLSTINNITSVLTTALGAIAAISLLVGGIGVMNIMLVSVTERTKEIGLRKALGAKRSDILKQFLIEATMLSLTGGIIGILLGMGISILVSIFFISVVTPWSVILSFSFSVAVGIIFGMAPAIKASKLSPIEALRRE